MKDVIIDDFQNIVSESLIRHKSIMDVLSKLQESGARINRALSKSITSCGCIEIKAKKQEFPAEIPEDMTLDDFNKCMSNHIDGALCEKCREVLEKEIGSNLYYVASLCNVLDINMYDVILKEYSKLMMLGRYNLR
ncbi:hypothetical protein OXPF_38370 [Oxobacter pfennigii]|uniref:DUF1573 domain-containing protein n=1 Tax=Oxobacter pfennigii TaxID=36849 RepID=A0A0P8W512_9CLOT|nr:hypothetical protein [Oxobacter pfennigii]KPU42660.1 hypothetical protein OXPF_38370 [Oxobacter pfennigii]